MDEQKSNGDSTMRPFNQVEYRYFRGNGRLSSCITGEQLIKRNNFSDGNPLAVIKKIISDKDVTPERIDDALSLFYYLIDEFENVARLSSPNAPAKIIYSMFCFKYEVRNR